METNALNNGWPDHSAIRLFIAQQLEAESAQRLGIEPPNQVHDPVLTDAQLDAAWPELDETLSATMANWQYPDFLTIILETEARRCAAQVLNKASDAQRKNMADVTDQALSQPAE